MAKRVDEKATVLVKEKKFVKFHRLLERAEAEGRLDGEHRCPLCGMRYLSVQESVDCCKIPPQLH